MLDKYPAWHTQHVARQKEVVMDNRFSGLIVTAAIAAAASVAISVSVTQTSAQAPAVSGAALKAPPLKTAWGEPVYRGFGPTNLRRPYSALPNMRTRNFYRGATR
jgi:hypothetical protein